MADRKRRRAVAMAVALIAVALGGCRDTGDESALFELGGKLFVLNYRVATATYLVNLVPLRPVEVERVAVASFENPQGGEAIVVRQKIWPRAAKVTIESPEVFCLVRDQDYAVRITIEDAQGVVLQTIDTTIQANVDQTVLPDRPLVVGPVYTPNPELAGHPDGKLPAGSGITCPATGKG